MRQTILQASQFFEQGALDDAEAAARESLDLLPDDPEASRLLGLIAAAKGNFAAALTRLHPLNEAYQNDPMVQTALAETVWALRTPAEAIPYLQQVLHIDPNRHRVRGRLGLAYLQSGQPAPACDELTRALAGRPDDVTLQLQLGLALRELGQTGAAIDRLREAVRQAPETAQLHTALGEALLDAGDASAAMAALAEAAKRDRSSHLTWMLLGRAASLAGHGSRSIECYQHALATVPQTADAEATVPARTALANALHEHGRIEEARVEFLRLMRPFRRRCRRPLPRQVRVGVLAAPGSANTPTDYLIDRQSLSVEPLFVVEGLDHRHLNLTERFDILFNAISDPDEAGSALHQAGQICEQFGRLTINPPVDIWPTTRDAMAARLTDTPDAVIPRTRRSDRAALLAGETHGLDFPLLLRPLGSHGGLGMVRVNDPKALIDAAASSSAEKFYLTEYIHSQSADGLWRKYRIIFIGGVAFPYHLSIAQDWLNHYFRTETNRHAALRAEEAAFLLHPMTAIGPRASRALGAIAKRMGLHYFGIDFALSDDGRLILFECNAAMRVRGAREPDSPKAQAAERIRVAMTQLLTPS